MNIRSSHSKKIKSEQKYFYKKNNLQRNRNSSPVFKSRAKLEQGQLKQMTQPRKFFYTFNLRILTPINLKNQKQTFFSKQQQYDPFFLYINRQQVQQEIKKYSICDTKYLASAISILQRSIEKKVPYLLSEQPKLTEKEVSTKIQNFISKLSIQNQITYEFTEDLIAPMTFIQQFSENNTQKSKILISLPIQYSQKTLLGVLYHQIGTHFLRKRNERLQIWSQNRSKYQLSNNYLEIQQGLAALNQLIPYLQNKQNIPPYLYKASLNYYSCYLASRYSFKDQFKILKKYQPNLDQNWRCCVRSRRGRVDTSKMGGMYKDQVYLIGAIKILKQRKKINFIDLYSGKINLEDCEKLSICNLVCRQKIKLPQFMSNINSYIQYLNEMAEVNMI